MDTTCIVRHLEARRYALGMAVALLAGGCAQIIGIEDLPDAFRVRGTATGVLGPVALDLRWNDGARHLPITEDGQFDFEISLANGDAYTVALADPTVPCTLRNATGVVAGEDPHIELTCTGPSLASIVVSGVAPAVMLEPGKTEYSVELPRLQQETTLTATVATPGDRLSIDGALSASGVGSTSRDLEPDTESVVDIVVENDLGWRRTYRLTLRRLAQLAQYAYAKASSVGAGDQFGRSVSLSSDTLAVGAPHQHGDIPCVDGDQNHGAIDGGPVHVFRRSGAAWLLETPIEAPSTNPGDQFGHDVALSGSILAVGAPCEDSAAQGGGKTATDSGAVYVFRRSGAAWVQEAHLKASNAGPGDLFGASLALVSEDILAVGAPREDSATTGVGGQGDDDDAMNSGAVYVFRRSGTTWRQEAYVKASNTDAGDFFGTSVALADDLLAVGAPFEDSAATGIGGDEADDTSPASGAAYVFRVTGTTWLQDAYVKASNTDEADHFGASTALRAGALAVGAPDEDSGGRGVGGSQSGSYSSRSGAVYVFRRSDAGWLQEAYVKASNTGAEDHFGTSVALSENFLVVGADEEDSAAQGVDGDQDDDSAPGSGAAYVFRHDQGWRQQAYVKASNPGAGDRFGASVAISGNAMAVGAYQEDSAAQGVDGDQDDDSAEDSGAAYVFH